VTAKLAVIGIVGAGLGERSPSQAKKAWAMTAEPGKEKNDHEPEKKHPYRFYWLTGGLATILAAIIAVVVVHPSPGASNAAGPATSSPTLSALGQSSPAPSGSSPSASGSQLEQALLPTDTLGPGGSITAAGTDLSKIGLICGGPLPGATATAYETIVDNQSGQILTETLTAWDNAAAARDAGMMNHQALDQNGSCSFSNSGATITYSGDYSGSPPSSCTGGQYLATGAALSSPSLVSSYSGYLVGALCGTVSVVVSIESDLPVISQRTADGYLNTAAENLESAGL
jgi:hypothetical protein